MDKDELFEIVRENNEKLTEIRDSLDEIKNKIVDLQSACRNFNVIYWVIVFVSLFILLKDMWKWFTGG